MLMLMLMLMMQGRTIHVRRHGLTSTALPALIRPCAKSCLAGSCKPKRGQGLKKQDRTQGQDSVILV